MPCSKKEVRKTSPILSPITLVLSKWYTSSWTSDMSDAAIPVEGQKCSGFTKE
jgi:hypothetical protein